MKIIRAVYENGVFRSTTPVDLPEGMLVRIEPEPVDQPAAPWAQDAGYLHGDPFYEPWRAAMEEYRRQLDEDPDVPTS